MDSEKETESGKIQRENLMLVNGKNRWQMVLVCIN
jgi:hypothetical protein